MSTNDHASNPPAHHQPPAASRLSDTSFSNARVPRVQLSCQASLRQRAAAFVRVSSLPPAFSSSNVRAKAQHAELRLPFFESVAATARRLNPQLRPSRLVLKVFPGNPDSHPFPHADRQTLSDAVE